MDPFDKTSSYAGESQYIMISIQRSQERTQSMVTAFAAETASTMEAMTSKVQAMEELTNKAIREQKIWQKRLIVTIAVCSVITVTSIASLACLVAYRIL